MKTALQTAPAAALLLLGMLAFMFSLSTACSGLQNVDDAQAVVDMQTAAEWMSLDLDTATPPDTRARIEADFQTWTTQAQAGDKAALVGNMLTARTTWRAHRRDMHQLAVEAREAAFSQFLKTAAQVAGEDFTDPNPYQPPTEAPPNDFPALPGNE